MSIYHYNYKLKWQTNKILNLAYTENNVILKNIYIFNILDYLNDYPEGLKNIYLFLSLFHYKMNLG